MKNKKKTLFQCFAVIVVLSTLFILIKGGVQESSRHINTFDSQSIICDEKSGSCIEPINIAE